MTAASDANPGTTVLGPGYDPGGHQERVAVRLVNIQTDTSVTPNIVYGDLVLGSITPGTGASNLGKGENTAYTQGDVGVALLGARNDSFSSLTTADGRYSFVAVDQFGRLKNNGVTAILDNATGTNLSNATGLFINPYPLGATPLTASSGNVANASAVATLAGTANKTTYISGFQITGSGATVGLPVTVTVTGLISGTNSYTYSAVAGVLLENQALLVTFNPPIPASAQNTAIVVTCPALGTGNTNNVVNAQGYQL